MGMISIRKFSKKMLAPVIVVLVVAMVITMFYVGFPMLNREVLSYQGEAVKLDGEIIKGNEFQKYITQASQQASQFAQLGIQYTQSQIRDMALSMAIEELAIKAEMKKVADKIKVTEADAEKLIKKYFPTEEELKTLLDRQGFRDKKELIKVLVPDMQKQKFFVMKAKELGITVSKEEVERSLIKDIAVSHILIGLNDENNKPLRTEEEALKRANEVLAKLNSGADFAELVKTYSDDPGSIEKGGKYGPMPVQEFASTMVREFVEGSLALEKVGDISKPVKTQYGYHIIRLDERTMPQGDEYEEQYKANEENLLLMTAQTNEEFVNWMKKISKEAAEKVDILDPGLRAYKLAIEKKWAEAATAYEKALKKKYYKKQWDLYLELSDVYVNLKKFEEAQAILKKIPADFQDSFEYQLALAKVYKEDKKADKAEKLLLEFGGKHADDLGIHQALQKTFTDWKMTEAAKKEEQIIAKLQKKQEEELKEYQRSLEQNAQTDADKEQTQAEE